MNLLASEPKRQGHAHKIIVLSKLVFDVAAVRIPDALGIIAVKREHGRAYAYLGDIFDLHRDAPVGRWPVPLKKRQDR
jgi:hypothetical protein